ncbi:MAG: TAXI family TRAP transporter solute-binding subunit [Paracoccaceae bacterium]
MIRTRTGLAAAVTAAALALGAAAASAQVVAIGSTQRGGTSQIGRAIAAAISEASPISARPQELANTSDYIPLVNAGELDFGVANMVQLDFAVRGEGMSAGRPHEELRMVATLMPFQNAYVVREDSGIESIPDLEGKRAPEFPDGALGDHVTRAYLANAGMTMDDVVGVPVPNFPRMWNSFAEGSTDVTIVVVGAANAREFDATLGGIRYLPLDPSEEAYARMQPWLPGTYPMEVTPESGIPGIDEPVIINAYDYTFFAGADTPEQTVYDAVKAMWEQEAFLRESSPIWRMFEKETMGKAQSVDYHPGAVRFYREMGVWSE